MKILRKVLVLSGIVIGAALGYFLIAQHNGDYAVVGGGAFFGGAAGHYLGTYIAS